MLELVKRIHYHSLGETQYISLAGHWISRLAGEGIWSIMKQPIDFCCFYLQRLAWGGGNFFPRACWLNVIWSLHSKHTLHLFSFHRLTFGEYEIFLLNVWNKKTTVNSIGKSFVWLGKRVFLLRSVARMLGGDYKEKYLKCAKCQIKSTQTLFIKKLFFFS